MPNPIKARISFGLFLFEDSFLRVQNTFLLTPSFVCERNGILQVGILIDLANLTQIWFRQEMPDALHELMEFKQVQERQRFESVHNEFSNLFAKHAELKYLFSRYEWITSSLDHGIMLH